jgi:hypothetical protein
VSLRLDGSEKDSVTVSASMTARADKLTFFAIAKEKATRAEQSQLGTDEALVRDHSPSAWSTLETFKHYLDWIIACDDAQCQGESVGNSQFI